MKRVIIASKNPVKVAVAKRAFTNVFADETFEFVALTSESGVSEQPLNDETLEGALNRLNYIKKHHPEAEYLISQEGGIYTDGSDMYTKAWIVICNKAGHTTKSSTAEFRLPTKIVQDIKDGYELGEATDRFFSSQNSKHGLATIGHLTDGLINREDLYVQPAIIALSELKHQEWYL